MQRQTMGHLKIVVEKDDVIHIGENIKLMLADDKLNRATVVIDAPKEMRITRQNYQKEKDNVK